MIGRIYKEDHYTLLHTNYESFGSCGFGEDFFYVFPMTPPVWARMDPRGTVGRIYKEDHYTLLLTKYESSGPCGNGEEDFFMFSHCKSMGANDPIEDHYTLLHTKYESSVPCGF